MNLPNKLTVSRFILTIAFLAVMFSQVKYHKSIALVLFVAAGLSDYLDGEIARRHKLITNFGILMDPLADKIMVCSAFIAFVGLNWIPAWMVVVVQSIVRNGEFGQIREGDQVAAGQPFVQIVDPTS